MCQGPLPQDLPGLQERVQMLESGMQWGLGACCHGYQEFLGEFAMSVGLGRALSSPKEAVSASYC